MKRSWRVYVLRCVGRWSGLSNSSSRYQALVLTEPLIHSHITDVLPADHPLAWETVYCDSCMTMVHASNNECMQTWAETGLGPFCMPCWGKNDLSVLDEDWGLRSG